MTYVLREHIAERERALSAPALEPERELAALEWIAWATGQVDRIDPAKRSFSRPRASARIRFLSFPSRWGAPSALPTGKPVCRRQGAKEPQLLRQKRFRVWSMFADARPRF